jgi:hypothetical protein
MKPAMSLRARIQSQPQVQAAAERYTIPRFQDSKIPRYLDVGLGAQVQLLMADDGNYRADEVKMRRGRSLEDANTECQHQLEQTAGTP